MGREYIPLFLDFNESTQDLTDEECGRLVRAIVDYANGNDYESRLTGGEKIAFRFIKGTIDRNQAISEVRAKAGANRRRQEQTEANDNKPEQTETNESKTEQMETNLPNKKLITKNKKENKNNNTTEVVSARFQKPTVEDIRSYILERNNGLSAQDAETFFDFYEAKGWKIGNNPMKNWKAAVRTWEIRRKGGNSYGGYSEHNQGHSTETRSDYSFLKP